MADKFRPTISTALPGYSKSAAIGGSLGTGLGHGLQLLLQDKMNRMVQQKQQKRTSSGLEALGFAPEQATALSGLDPKILETIVKQKAAEPSQMAFSQGLSALLGTTPTQEGEGTPGVPGIGQVPLNAQQATKLAELSMKKEEGVEKKLAGRYKATKEFRDQARKEASSSRENLKRIERMEILSKRGKLSNPLYVAGLKKIGLDIPALMTADSQEFEKLTIDFLRGAREIFGARVTNFEAEMFLKSIPSLMQSKAGREKVINNLKNFYTAGQLKEKAAREIVKEEKGIPPFNLADLVEERISPQLDKLKKEFLSGIVGDNLVTGQSFNNLPDPVLNPGAEIQDEDSGEVFVSKNGKWVKIRG